MEGGDGGEHRAYNGAIVCCHMQKRRRRREGGRGRWVEKKAKREKGGLRVGRDEGEDEDSGEKKV